MDSYSHLEYPVDLFFDNVKQFFTVLFHDVLDDNFGSFVTYLFGIFPLFIRTFIIVFFILLILTTLAKMFHH